MADKNTAGKIALGGILLAFVVIILYAESVLPTGKFSLYVLSSFFAAAILIHFGVKTAWLFYGTSCLLSLILLPEKLSLVPYILFFGVYAIIKYLIEKLDKPVTRYLLKYLFFNAVLAVSYLIAGQFIAEEALTSLPVWGVISGFQLLFMIYDYVFTLFIRYYYDRIRKYIRF